MHHPRSIYSSKPTQSYHFQANLNWCDGTFNVLIGNEQGIAKYFWFCSKL
jgi:hypothetical protein